MKKATFYSVLFLSFSVFLPAQNTTRNIVPTPPENTVRTMAEWEEVQAVVITWTTAVSTLTEIVRHAVEECQVLIVTTDPVGVEQDLQAAGISTEHVDYLDQAFNSIWIRDYGPWTVYQNDVEQTTIIDWIYNRPERVADDTIPRRVASYFELEHFEAIQEPFDWIHAGGNHLTDGMGTAFSSSLVLDENPNKNEFAIDSIAQKYLGINQYYKLPKLPFDGIHHLDMHMRLLDEETILVGQYPEGVADGPQIEQNIHQILTSFQTPFGNPYRIIRIPMPEDRFGNYPDESSMGPCENPLRAYGCYRTYTNSLFINKTILVPTYGHELDSIALNIYRQELPGYKVVGIDCNEIIPRVGALHCITKLVGINNPLWIAHGRLADTYETNVEHPIVATIDHQSGISKARLYYRTSENSAFIEMDMELASTEENLWVSNIPAQAAGTTVQYYIEAVAVSGKVQRRPMVAPEGYFKFEVKENFEAPVADFFASVSESCTNQGIKFANNTSVPISNYLWSFPGGTPSTSVSPSPIVSYAEAGNYEVSLSVTNSIGTHSHTISNMVQVLGEGQAPFFEDFEDTSLAHWEIRNPTNDATWEWSPAGFCTGSSIRMDNFTEKSWGTSDYLQTQVNLSDLEEVYLHFDVAYAMSNAHQNRRDALLVKVKTCEGKTHIVYSKLGAELSTENNSNTFFIPNSCGDWRHEVVDLSAFAGESITLLFENMGDSGNFLYLDNIDFESPQIPNIEPTVDWVSPSSGELLQTSLSAINLQAFADDEDGYIKRVSFFVNGDSVGVATTTPFEIDYTFPEEGIYMLRAKATDNDGAERLSQAVQIELLLVDNVYSLSEQEWSVQTFPIPVKEELGITINAPKTTTLQFAVFDIAGKLLKQSSWEVIEGENSFQLDVRSLSAGMYQLHLFQEQHLIYKNKILIR